MHRRIVSNRNSRRNEKTRSRQSLPNFTSGDVVLIATPLSSCNFYRHKLQARWTGPSRIVDCLSDNVFLVENFITREQNECHVQRLRFYADSSLGLTEELYDQIAHDNSGYEIEDLIDYMYDESEKSWLVLVRWRGFSSCADTWEPVRSLFSQIPVLLRRRAKAYGDLVLMQHLF